MVPAVWLLTVVAVGLLYRFAPGREAEHQKTNGTDGLVPVPNNERSVSLEGDRERVYESEHERVVR